MTTSKIAWREPLGARARTAGLEFRGAWRLPVAAGAALTLVGTTLLVVWAHSLNEPLNLRATVLMCGAGFLVIFLLTVDDFIPRNVSLGEHTIRITQPSQIDRIRYTDLRTCDLTAEPDPQFRGFGETTEPLFAVLWDPSIDGELLRAFLLTKGITFTAKQRRNGTDLAAH